MGTATGLGPAAMAGDILSWVHKGHDFLNSFVKGEIGGQ